MARAEVWNKLRYFKKDSLTDKWGDQDAISETLLLRLDDFRHHIGSPVIVTNGVKTKGHSAGSFHYSKIVGGEQIGYCAVDIVIPDYQGSPFDLILDATRFGFTGIGYYPHWKFKGETVGGLHLDTRPMKWDSDETLNYAHSRWMGVKKNGEQVYIPLTFNNLIKYFGSEGTEKILG